MTEDRQLLVRKRASLKATLTVQEAFFTNFAVNSIDDHELLSSRLYYITNILPRFDDIQTEIESLDEETDITEIQILKTGTLNWLLNIELYCEKVNSILAFKF